MAENFSLDSELLGDAIKKLSNSSMSLQEAYDNLMGILGPRHGCWGDDDIGRSFAQNYVGSAQQLQTAGQDVATGVEDLGKSVSDADKAFRGLDEQSAERLDRMNVSE